MGRLVLTGTKDVLYRLRLKDLPSDHNLRGSILKWVDLSGFDLSGYDCRFMDIHDSLAHDVILSANVDYLVSLRSDWQGARIPKLVPFCGWSLISEVLRQHTAPSGSREAEMIEWVQRLIASSDTDSRNPWHVSRQYFEDELGVPPAKAYQIFATYVFGRYPRLLSALANAREAENSPNTLPVSQRDYIDVSDPDFPDFVVRLGKEELRPLGTEDRWAAARMIEQHLDSRYLSEGWKVMLFFLTPKPWAIIAYRPEDREEEGIWWSKGMALS